MVSSIDIVEAVFGSWMRRCASFPYVLSNSHLPLVPTRVLFPSLSLYVAPSRSPLITKGTCSTARLFCRTQQHTRVAVSLPALLEPIWPFYRMAGTLSVPSGVPGYPMHTLAHTRTHTHTRISRSAYLLVPCERHNNAAGRQVHSTAHLRPL